MAAQVLKGFVVPVLGPPRSPKNVTAKHVRVDLLVGRSQKTSGENHLGESEGCRDKACSSQRSHIKKR